ncbi:FAD-dependent oxidoreductase [Oleiharenicola lentus]|uniref:FAD-dependent oxidoreductase n=1 Tax=Oleiharenicola lentus TaxID=2508720 RepID=UPI003F66BF82
MPLPRYYQPAPLLPLNAAPLIVDLCVYGANAAGVMAAVQARRSGLSVALLNPAQQIGGLTTGGLGFTDFGNKSAVGGLALEFYRRVGAHYGKAEEWCFEPSVAEKVLAAFLTEADITVHHGHYIKSTSVTHDASGRPRLTEIVTTSGLRVRAAYFIDCSYEGDLMAKAGVSFIVGRESSARYGESFNGQQTCATHQFDRPVDPYIAPGDPASGLLPGIDADATFIPGSADRRVQAYNFRMCMTKRADVRVPFPKPTGYNRCHYELLARYFAAGGARQAFVKFERIQNAKTDTNNHGAVSTDFIGANWAWPEGDYETREKIFQAHVSYQQGYHWFMANDPAVPEEIRSVYAQWGLCSDEFTATDHWPHQLYIREARRLDAEVTTTQKHCFSMIVEPDPIALGAYGMDSHNCRRFVHQGMVLNEGDVQVKLPRPYGISYRSIIPRAKECANLLVPVCASASHIAYGSLRMEPVFMILAQSATIAAALALDAKHASVQEVSYQDLKLHLLKAGQAINASPSLLNPTSGNESLD